MRVTITGPVPKPKLGLPCSLAEWFKEAGRKVPAELTDEAWGLAELVVKAWEPPNHKLIPGRLMLDAMFYKAGTGCKWSDLPERFGLWKGIHSRYKAWRNCGVWDEVMASLSQDGPGYRLVPELNLVPPFRVEGRVDPRVLTGADIQEEVVAPEAGVPTPVSLSVRAAPAALLLIARGSRVRAHRAPPHSAHPGRGTARGPCACSSQLCVCASTALRPYGRWPGSRSHMPPRSGHA